MDNITVFSGHRDGVYVMSTHPKRLPIVISGACDGELKVWNVTSKECLCSAPAHSGFVRGLGINQVQRIAICYGIYTNVIFYGAGGGVG